MVRLDDFYHQLDYRGRREEFAAFLAFAQSELAQEELVDFAENIAAGIGRDIGEILQQFRQQGVAGSGKGNVLILGKNAVQLGLVFLDGFHRLLDLFGQLLLLR